MIIIIIININLQILKYSYTIVITSHCTFEKLYSKERDKYIYIYLKETASSFNCLF